MALGTDPIYMLLFIVKEVGVRYIWKINLPSINSFFG